MAVTTKEFITRAKNVHGDKYDYSKSICDGVDNKITIICPDHGEFSQRASKHMRGEGCKDCGLIKRGLSRRLSQKEVLLRFKEAHGERFDYSKVEYVNTDKKVKIICPEHGEFEQTPYHHSKGQNGCVDCKNEILRDKFLKDGNQFIEEATKKHQGKWDYSKVDYKGAKVKVVIICKHHGEFKQDPDHHLNALKGCPECGREVSSLGYTLAEINENKINLDGRLYVVRAFDEKESFYKIGITIKTIEWRFRGKGQMPYEYEVICDLELGLAEAFKHEQFILNKYNKFKYKPKKHFNGVDECLSENPIELDDRLKELAEQYSDLN